MMDQSSDHRGQTELTVNIFVREEGAQAELKDTKLVKVYRDQRQKEIHIYLPDKHKIASTGWVPEVVYKAREAGEIVDVVVSQRLVPVFQRLAYDVDDGDFRCVTPRRQDDGIRVVSADDIDQPKEHPVCSESNREIPQKDPILYKVTFENGEIRMNGSVLCKPNFNSENEVVFDYLFKNPNRKLGIQDIESGIQRSIKKRFIDIVRTLGFRKELKTMFFPLVSKTAIKFVNPITRTDFEKRGLRAPRITEA